MKKIISMMLALLMIVSIIPMSAMADATYSWTVASTKETTLAKGVTQNEYVAYNTEGDRVAFYTVTSDILRDDVDFHANYFNNQLETLGMQTIIDQAHAAEKNHADVPNYKVVATANADFYNMANGKPMGVLVMEGVALENMGKSNAYFAVLKDGTPIIGKAGTYNSVADNVQEAIGGSKMIMYDGEFTVSNTDRTVTNALYPRSIIGITEDKKVISLVADGNQSPVSAGMSYYDVAVQMQAMGCTHVLELDGGGSANMATKAEGSNELTTLSKPSDGAPRNVSSSYIIVSTAVSDGIFDHASLEAEETYVTPESSVKVSAIGVDASGGVAEIPEDISWQLKDASIGTVKDGVFTSNGTVGEAVVQMVYNGNVVGETTINVVVPTAIAFSQSTITVPYGKTIELDVTATINDGLNKVAFNEGDITFSLEDNKIGSLNGNSFTACEENKEVTGGNVQAKLIFDTSVTATAEISLGKGSVIVYDFEEGQDSIKDLYLTYKDKYVPGETYYFYDDVSVVTAENGKVKNGNYAFKFDAKRNSTSVMNWCQTRINGLGIDLTDAVSVSFWMYIPEGSHGYEWDFGNAIPIGLGHEFVYGTGWQYFTVPVSSIGSNVTKLDQIRLYTSDTDNASLNYKHTEHPNYYADVIYYMDDITVNFSKAVEDFSRPIFTNSTITYEGSADTNGYQINGQEIPSNVVSVTAYATEDTTASNISGLDTKSAVVYVDGVKVDSSCSEAGVISTNYFELANGAHTFRFEISDKNGNQTYLEKQIVIADKDSSLNSIKYVNVDDTLENVPLGSLIWKNLVADAIEDVKEVEVVVDLDNNSVWELEHMVVADGFTSTYSIDKETNDATIKLTRSGETAQTGNVVLAQLPIRVWEPDFSIEKADRRYRLISVMSHVEKGKVTNVNDEIIPFGSEEIVISTEMNGTRTSKPINILYHVHETVAADDVAPTCTTDGYEGRTVCKGCICETVPLDDLICTHTDGCGSVVDWGTIIPATGHTYEVEDGVLKCKDCDKLYNGELDGKTYVDGIALDGWVGDKYYKDGAMLTGVKEVEGVYYDFGENGVSKGKFTGDFTGEDGKHYYAKLGVLEGGWFTIDDEWYYFDETTFAGVSGEMKFFSKVTYTFDETGRLTTGVWYTDEIGTRYYYGPDYYKTILTEIDGKQYYFADGYRYEEGIHCLRLSAGNTDVVAYEFAEDGSIIGEYKGNGLVNTAEGKFLLKDGIAQRGLRLVDGNYYYFHTIYGYAYVYRTYNVTQLNGYDFTAGVYEFDENGVIIDKNGYYEENGVNYYYVNNVKMKNTLVKIDDDYYYFADNGQIVKDGKYYVSNTVCDMPAKNSYYFDAEGKALQGVIDGKLYINGQLAPTGLHKVGDDYYYSESGKIIVDRKYYAAKSNCELEPKAYYYFDAEGKALKGVVDGKLYINGQIAPTGLTQYGEDYYYSESGKVVVDRRYYAAKSNCDLPEKDYYNFGADGKMLQGVVDGKLYINGQPAKRGLTKFRGDYYYSESGKVIVDRRYYATLSNCDLPEKEYYFFGADGKMLQGVVDGKLYINGQIAKRGLVKYGDDYYYSESGKVIVDRKYYAELSNCDLPAKDYYYFGVDGKMLQGVVDGKLYINGQIAPTGLTKYGDDYYYSESGKVATGKYYAAKSNCELAAETYYYFGEDGKMLEGVVDGYLYIGGQKAATGLTKYGDDYYYSESGKLIVDRKYYAAKSNCELAAKDYYYFGVDGKLLEGVVDGYLYIGGQKAATGLTKYGDDYYYSESGKLATGKCYAKISNCELEAGKYYYFDLDGTFCEGVYVEEDGVYYYEAGKRVYAGLVKVGNDFYYAAAGGKCATNTKLLCKKSSCVLPINREYTFGNDGKIVK